MTSTFQVDLVVVRNLQQVLPDRGFDRVLLVLLVDEGDVDPAARAKKDASGNLSPAVTDAGKLY